MEASEARYLTSVPTLDLSLKIWRRDLARIVYRQHPLMTAESPSRSTAIPSGLLPRLPPPPPRRRVAPATRVVGASHQRPPPAPPAHTDDPIHHSSNHSVCVVAINRHGARKQTRPFRSLANCQTRRYIHRWHRSVTTKLSTCLLKADVGAASLPPASCAQVSCTLRLRQNISQHNLRVPAETLDPLPIGH